MKYEPSSTGVLAVIKTGAQEIAESFDEPDDDWGPTLFAFADGELSVMTLEGMPPNVDERADMIRKAFHSIGSKPAVVGCVLSAWTSTIGKPEDRRESLVIQVADRHQHLVQVAQINRWDGRPPTLGIWEKWDSASLFGPMTDAFRDAVS